MRQLWTVFLCVCVWLAATARAIASDVVPIVLANGLIHPWAIAFIDAETMLVTERGGNLRTVGHDGSISPPIQGLPPITAVGQGGLLDVIVDRAFEINRQIYFCFTQADPLDESLNRTALASARLREDLREITDLKILFTQKPSYRGGYHFGCRIVDPGDGSLFLGLGDRYYLMEQAQSRANEIGKVVRVNKDGTIPLTNPFRGVDGVSGAVWSTGHRNIQGATLGIDADLWIVEHGPQGGDELNLIKPAINYGWPVITYGENYGGGPIGAGITKAPGMAQPVTYWVPSIAPSGLAWLDSDRYGASWANNLLVGSLKFGYLVRLVLKDNRVVAKHIVQPELKQRVRDVRVGPDGLIYILTDSANGQLIQLRPNQSR